MKQNGARHFDFPCKWYAAQKTVLWGNITWTETAKQNIQAKESIHFNFTSDYHELKASKSM